MRRSAATARRRVACDASPCRGDDVVGVVSPHRTPLAAVVGRRRSSAVMIRSRLPRTCWFISARRVWPRASAAVMSSMTCRRWVRCWGRNSAVVRNIGQVRQALACGQVFWTGRPQNPLGSAWVARPRRCLAQAASASGPSGSTTTVCAGDVDLAGGFPVPADGGVVQPGVVRGHLRGVVIEDAPHDLLRDVPVDQPGAEGVPPLVRGQPDRAAVCVADIAAGQPAVEREPVGRCGDRGPAVGVLRRPREQHRRRRPTRRLLLDDQGVELLVDRDQRLAFHLVVEVAQVGRAVGVE